MKRLFQSLRQTLLAGFFFLFPLYVIFVVLTKAWTSLSVLGSKLASMLGAESVLGVRGRTVFSGLLLIAIWLVCGLLMRFSFVGSFSRAVDDYIASLIPGYASYRATFERKFHHKRRLPYKSALLKRRDCWQPVFIVEQNEEHAIVFLPDVPETNRGIILLASLDQIRPMPTLSPNKLDGALRAMGKGLLSECDVSRMTDKATRAG